MKYEEHEIIEVPHQGRVKTWSCKSYVDAAKHGRLDTWDYEEFESFQDVVDSFGGFVEDIPEELKKAEFPCVVIHWPGEFNYHDIVPASEFDAESEAADYLFHDLNSVVIIDSDEDALYEMKRDHGHMDSQIKAAAREIYDRHNN